QMVLNQEGQAFTDVPFFNATFVRASGLKSMEGKVSIKKPGDIIRESKDIYRIEFDSLGKVTKIMETKTQNVKKDTVYQSFQYDKNGKLLCLGKYEFGGLTANYMIFDAEGKLVKLEQRKDILSKNGEVEKTVLVNTESYTYQKLPFGEKKIFLNSYNLPYMEETEDRNTDGYLILRTQRLKMSDAQQIKKYDYNDKGLLRSIAVHYNNSEKPIEEQFFRYDELGNLIEKHSYKSGVFVEDLQLIYDPKTACIASFIQLNKLSGVMKIVTLNDLVFF
ncbi:MAG: hypothetical protein FJZ66_10100, partial [Bacteroidetes bacterium]|nr:hypothetical protein [Bacteroidota bacterium]